MRYSSTSAILIQFLLAVFFATGVYGQQHTVHAKNGLNATPRNYYYFTAPYKSIGTETAKANAGYEHHPELGMLFAETPCDNCYELIGKRTAISKTFIKEGTAGKDVMQQTATLPMHYKDAEGNWRTVKTKLEPDGGANDGLFAAMEQEIPVMVSPKLKNTSIGKAGQSMTFNNALELVFERADGTQELIGVADYSHFTAGDDGVYVTDMWPGIDAEMYVARGGIKTNFVINHAMPGYAAGKLRVRDHIGMSSGWAMNVPGENKERRIGNIEVRNSEGGVVYNISPATAYEKKESVKSLQMLEYAVSGNVLDIVLPGDFLNRSASAYPVVIDPLVSLAVSSSVGGSAYSAGWTAGCTYSNPASVPAGITVTDIQFTFSYTTSGGAHINNGANDFRLGSCRSPSAPGYWWRCTDTGVGTCNETGVTIFPELHSCIPAATCTPYDLNLTMYFYQNFAPTSLSCSNSYISALGNLTVTVFGHIVETGSITATSSSICQGQSTVLTASSVYGVAPISYTWAPGGLTGSSVTVNPTSTTTYTLTLADACGNSSASTYTVNVNPLGPITGIATVCVGGTTTLSNTAGSGTWTSSNVAKATVGASSGIVTGVSKGSATITYTSLAGCTTTIPLSVKFAVAPIAGPSAICQGSNATLSDTTSAGTWSSSLPSVASVSGTGGLAVATGLSGGTAVISYTTYGGGCYATKNLTINALSAIAGVSSICLGATTTLSNAAPGGTWTSSNPAIAAIGSSSGVVTSLAAGVDTITYSLPSGCVTTRSLTVSLLSPVTGTMALCQGGNTTLAHTLPGGTWTSSVPAVATVNATTGVVSGAGGGITLISYTLPGGCSATANVTVNAMPSIAGPTAVCVGGATGLTGSTGSGAWVSSNAGVASVGVSSGIVTGVAVGICNITFTSGAGCTNHTTMNVSVATPVTGPSSVCPGGTIALNNITTGGTWSSANTAIATVGLTSGIVTGVAGGVVDIYYTNPSGCVVTASIAVNTILPITGTTNICAGNTSTLSNAIASGSWSSSNTSVATIDILNGILTGVAAGASTISYTTPAGCVVIITANVSEPQAITGVTSVCQGGTSLLSNVVAGGVWNSSNTSIAGISGTSGLVSALTAGNTNISYTTTSGCVSTAVVTVNPVSPITGIFTLCAGTTTTLHNAIVGGTWSSVLAGIATVGTTSGVLTGMAAGSTTISYTTGAGCVSSSSITVNTSPSAISGPGILCTSTTLTDAVPGGSWMSSNPAVATIGASTGIAYGLAPGSVTITYTLPGGCATTTTVTVDPVLPITGGPNVCAGSTITLSYPSAGGLWSSLNPGIAAVGSGSGIVTGVASGTTTISYVTPAGCIASKLVNVSPILPIAGSGSVCQNSTVTLTDATPGGSWSTSDAALAPVGALTGIVTGVLPGVATISYTTALGCVATKVITVNEIDATTGTPSICAGSTTTLVNNTPGTGSWSSLLPAVASVSSSTGLVTGLSAGTVTIRYTSSLGCVANFTETINPMPSAIIGSLSVCMGSTSSLSNALAGGTWSSSDITVATVGASSGVLAGVSTNTVTITYTSGAGCARSADVTVNPLPQGVTGFAFICEGATTTLANATPGGSWSSMTSTVASVSVSGVVSGLLAGTSYIRYTTAAGCFSARQVTVNALPSVIGGSTVLCEGATSSLTNTLAGGTWSSTNTSVATIGALSGVLSGVAAGNATVTYITAAGCYSVAGVTVNTTPVISGHSSTDPTTCVSTDGTITLDGLHAGETYTVHYQYGLTPVTASLTASGAGKIVISSLAAGSYTNLYVTTAAGCSSNQVAGPVVLSLPPTPATPVAGNNTPICAGVNIKLTATDATSGVAYSWSGPGGFSSTVQNPIIAASSVVMSGVYTVTATKLACVSAPATTTVVVHPIPTITKVTSSNPTTCQGSDGVITLQGLDTGVSYTVNYTRNGAPVGVSKLADGSGYIRLTGLTAGNYVGFIVSSFTCLSNYAGPVTLIDPPPPPAPIVYSNSPVCAGRTMLLNAVDSIFAVSYDWSGPNGFSSQMQSPQIENIPVEDSGIYTLTVRYRNCPVTATVNVTVHQSVVLKNETQDQVLPLGGSLMLHADGGDFYMWSPNDGSLSDPNIDSPIVNPQVSTVYRVISMNQWGCGDSATVSITVDDNVTEYLPTAFTPNDDGKNDVFRIINVKYDKLVEFDIYNRWGQLVYRNTYEPAQGWDGKFNGVPQDIGTYFYSIIVTKPDGKTRTIRGEVVLMR